MINDDPIKLNSAALKWLYELELVQSPTLLSNLYENIFLSHTGIKNCELLLTDPNIPNKGVLVYIELYFWSRFFKKEEVITTVEQTIRALLPSYRIRVVTDYSILKMAKNLNKELSNDFRKKRNSSGSDDINS